MGKQISRNFQAILFGFNIVCGVCFPALALSHNEPSVEFKNQGKVVTTLTLKNLASIAPPVSLKIFEIHENKNRVYKSYAARILFDNIYGKEWKNAEEVVLVALDGYQASIPVSKFLTHDAYFAFAYDDHSPFKMTNRLQNNEQVQLRPLYLIWDNLKSKALLTEGVSDMPYQIKSIELATFATLFPNLSPPAAASAEARRGFLHFRKHCMTCHTINGEGGNKAPELNFPVSVVEYIKPEYLSRWIENPSSIRHNTRMPGLAQSIPNRTKVVQEILAYLKAMSTAKRNPKRNDRR